MEELAGAGAPVARDQPPGARPGERLAQVGAAQAPRPVGVAGADHQRRRSEQDGAVGAAGEVGAEEGKLGVGDRVDVRAHELGALGPQSQVAAAKRDDPRVGGRAGRAREPVRPGAGAGDRPRARRVAPRGMARRRPRRRRLDRGHRAAGVNAAARRPRRRRRRPPRRRRSRRPRSPASAARRSPRRAARSRGSRRHRRGAGRGRRWPSPGARARRGARARPRPSRRSASRRGARRSPARRSTRRARAAPATHSRAFSEPGS